MAGVLRKQTIFLSLFLVTVEVVIPLTLVGIRTESEERAPPEIETDEEAVISLFGSHLVGNNYYFIPSQDCASTEKRVVATVDKEHVGGSHVTLRATFPDPTDSIDYLLCNNATQRDPRVKPLLTVRRTKSNYLPKWLLYCMALILLFCSGMFSGLNFAFMCLSMNDLMLIKEYGTAIEKTYAQKIVFYRKRGNWLICTFAICNVATNTLLTSLTTSIVPPSWHMAIRTIVPTALIVTFGELIPQAVCYRRGLMIAAQTRHITLLFLILAAPFAWPLSKLVDWLLGRDVFEFYNEEELKGLLEQRAKGIPGSEIISRVFDLPKKTAARIMTPMDSAFLLSTSDRLDMQTMIMIVEKGYTRIPIYIRENMADIRYVLNVKDLILVCSTENILIEDLINKLNAASGNNGRMAIRYVMEGMKVDAVMFEMVKGENHLCVVVRYYNHCYRIIGLLTLEDVMEEVFGEIEDDSDKSWANRRTSMHRDQTTLDWFRAKPTNAELGINDQLGMIQCLLIACPELIEMGLSVPIAHELLSPKNLKFVNNNRGATRVLCTKGEELRHIYAIYRGNIGVDNTVKKPPIVIGVELAQKLFKTFMRLSLTTENVNNMSVISPAKYTLPDGAWFYQISPADIVKVLSANYKKHITKEYVYVTHPPKPVEEPIQLKNEVSAVDVEPKVVKIDETTGLVSTTQHSNFRRAPKTHEHDDTKTQVTMDSPNNTRQSGRKKTTRKGEHDEKEKLLTDDDSIRKKAALNTQTQLSLDSPIEPILKKKMSRKNGPDEKEKLLTDDDSLKRRMRKAEKPRERDKDSTKRSEKKTKRKPPSPLPDITEDKSQPSMTE